LPGVSGIGHHVDLPAGQGTGQRGGHLPGQHQPGGGRGLQVLVHQPGQDRQRNRPGAERHRDDDRGDHPVVAQPHLAAALGGAVVEPADRVHLRTGALEQGVVDGHQHRLAGRHQQ